VTHLTEIHLTAKQISSCFEKLLPKVNMATSLLFVTLDVFSAKRFRGNPLAVVFLPETNSLTQERKQLIAREFNYSETIFVHPPVQPGNRKIDIFTTAQELPFAGHPTIGATWLFLLGNDQGERPSTITTKAGDIPISVSAEYPDKVCALIPHDVHVHSARVTLPDLVRLHPSLEPYLDSATHAGGFPVVSIVKGMTAVHIRLPNLEALKAVTTATGGYEIPSAGVSGGGYLDPGWDVGGHVAVYLHVRDVWDEELQADVIRSRMVAGNSEDPATGSAASGLAAYLTLTDPGARKSRATSYRIVQGAEMGQRSEIEVRVALKEDSNEISTIELMGSAVKVSEGNIFVTD
jgi:predicted PhzF superfamily epimerase YddE/YHI9